MDYSTMYRLVFEKPTPVAGDGFFYSNFSMLRNGKVYYGEDVMARASKKPADNKPRAYARRLKPVAWLKVILPDGTAEEIAKYLDQPESLFMQVCIHCLEGWDISIKLEVASGKATAFAFCDDPSDPDRTLGISAGSYSRFGALYALCVKLSTVGDDFAEYIVERTDNPVW
jgi:hypothetical protein